MDTTRARASLTLVGYAFGLILSVYFLTTAVLGYQDITLGAKAAALESQPTQTAMPTPTPFFQPGAPDLYNQFVNGPSDPSTSELILRVKQIQGQYDVIHDLIQYSNRVMIQILHFDGQSALPITRIVILATWNPALSKWQVTSVQCQLELKAPADACKGN